MWHLSQIQTCLLPSPPLLSVSVTVFVLPTHLCFQHNDLKIILNFFFHPVHSFKNLHRTRQNRVFLLCWCRCCARDRHTGCGSVWTVCVFVREHEWTWKDVEANRSAWCAFLRRTSGSCLALCCLCWSCRMDRANKKRPPVTPAVGGDGRWPSSTALLFIRFHSDMHAFMIKTRNRARTAQTSSLLQTQTSSLFTFCSACYQISSWIFTYSCVPRMGSVFSFAGRVILRVLLWLIHAHSFHPAPTNEPIRTLLLFRPCKAFSALLPLLTLCLKVVEWKCFYYTADWWVMIQMYPNRQ